MIKHRNRMYKKETNTVDWSKDGTIYEHTEVKLNQNNTQKYNHPSIFLNASIEGHRWAGFYILDRSSVVRDDNIHT